MHRKGLVDTRSRGGELRVIPLTAGYSVDIGWRNANRSDGLVV